MTEPAQIPGTRQRRAEDVLPPWLRTLTSILVTGFGAGVGVVLWLGSHYVTQDQFHAHALAQDQAGYATKTEVATLDLRLQAFDARAQAAQAQAVAVQTDLASIRTDLAWVKTALVRIEAEALRREDERARRTR